MSMSHADGSRARTVDRLVGLRLRQFQRVTGLPAVFGGATAAASTGPQLRIGHVRGGIGRALSGLHVGSGRGLGGSACASGELRTVRDYASTSTITHDFDDIVVRQEQLSSIFALPLVIEGEVHGVLYGALRGPHRIGDVVLERAVAFGATLEREIDESFRAAPLRASTPGTGTRPQDALAELLDLAATTRDRALGATLHRLAEQLSPAVQADAPTSAEHADGAVVLAPREIEALDLVAVGLSNREIATAMGLSVETVRSYLRSASRRLDVHNRTAAVHAARELGVLGTRRRPPA